MEEQCFTKNLYILVCLLVIDHTIFQPEECMFQDVIFDEFTLPYVNSEQSQIDSIISTHLPLFV